MRDGVRLFTAVYAPKDTSTTYPFLMRRTPYPTFPISTSDMRFADLPVTNNQNLSALQPKNKCFSSYFG